MLSKKPGKFELADGSTLFLDEVGELSLNVQAKLLRAIQEKAFERLGGTCTVKVDVRIIAATNKNLQKAVEEGKFRDDLYYRINVINLEVPPLRFRK
ncbi:Nif-specific regulatory protein [Koleobacter methoxysyntrophicus]|uniref:Nif-specific regulatory protein n=1 Tax=Koleobacter methoxysyntrophicus TaxID=2751313 RepID=A0A8A0RLZ7_9FIRM|nr:Nif-specific regulatory protein [Koleobacter methoxysyntrophicus]